MKEMQRSTVLYKVLKPFGVSRSALLFVSHETNRFAIFKIEKSFKNQ
jgi:hypothetical protein